MKGNQGAQYEEKRTRMKERSWEKRMRDGKGRKGPIIRKGGREEGERGKNQDVMETGMKGMEGKGTPYIWKRGQQEWGKGKKDARKGRESGEKG